MIKLNPANKGKFTVTKKREGKTTAELAHSKNPLTKKRAIFAENFGHKMSAREELDTILFRTQEQKDYIRSSTKVGKWGAVGAAAGAGLGVGASLLTHGKSGGSSKIGSAILDRLSTKQGAAIAGATIGGKIGAGYGFSRLGKRRSLSPGQGVVGDSGGATALSAREELASIIEFKAFDLGRTYPDYGGCGLSPAKDSPTKKSYPTLYVSDRDEEIDLPMSGKATVTYKVRSKSMNQNEDGKKRHSADIEIQDIDPIKEEAKLKEGGRAKIVKMSARDELNLIRFGGDPRPRNTQGEFSNSQDGPSPDAIGITYKQGLTNAASGVAEGAAGALAVNKGPGAIKKLLAKMKKAA